MAEHDGLGASEGKTHDVQGVPCMSRCSSLSSDSGVRACSCHESPKCIQLNALAPHVSCGLCNGPVAASLLLSCSHLFCGDCIFKHLSAKQQCPVCNMDLRTVPVRCLAMDKVAASVVPSLALEQQQQYEKRKKDGQCAADKVNKMFWYLAPSALPSNSGLPLHSTASLGSSGMPFPASSLDYRSNSVSPAGLALDPKATAGLLNYGTATHQLQHQQQLSAATSVLPFGGIRGVSPTGMPNHLAETAAAGNAASLLQLAAAAQQVAQMQQLAQVQQQMGSMQLNPACRQLAPAAAGVHMGLFGGADASSYFGMASQPLPMSGVSGYHDMQQLSNMLGSMCQV